MATPCWPHAYLEHIGSVTKKLNPLKLHLKKFCHTTTVGGRAILMTYLNSMWKNTLEI
jgi:hypothetical protein